MKIVIKIRANKFGFFIFHSRFWFNNRTKQYFCIHIAKNCMPLTNNVDKNSLGKITAINNCAILHEIAHFSNTNESVKLIIEPCFVFSLLIVVSFFAFVKDFLFFWDVSDRSRWSRLRLHYLLVGNYFQLTVIKNYGRKLRLRLLLC